MKILIQAYVWPEWTSSAAGLRDLNLIDSFLEQKWDVTVASGSAPTEFKKKLESKGVATYFCEPNHSQYDDWIKELNPDVVIFDRFITEEQFSFRVREQCPNALRVVDTQDLHFLRRARESAARAGKSVENVDLDTEDRARELASIYRSDLTWVMSSYEQELLVSHYNVPRERCEVSRFQYDLSKIKMNPPYSERNGFVWIGNFRHAPNWDSFVWLRDKIWPEIKKINASAKIEIYGAYPPKEAMQSHDLNSGFIVKGPVEDHLSALKKAKVLLAPLRFGAGIKGKITDSWMCGTPVVTTWIGREGLSAVGDDRFGGKVSETLPKEFAQVAHHLESSEPDWQSAQQSSQDLMVEYFDREKNSKKCCDQILGALDSRDHFRKNNWIGQMLWYHGNRSTQYFSKWIEEKQKNVGLK